MHRKITSLFILLLLLKISNAQNIYVGLHLNKDKEYKTKKPIEIQENNIYYLDSTGFNINIIKTLDQSGMLLDEKRFSDNGDRILRLQYLNDTINMIKTSLLFERWTQGYEKMIFLYTYDQNKHLTSITEKDTLGNTIHRYEYVCNEKGYPFEMYDFDSSGNKFLKESAVYLYNTNQVASSLFLNGASHVFKDTFNISDEIACKFQTSRNKFNSNCDQTNFSRFDSNGNELFFQTEYEYDRFGNRSQERSYTVSLDSNGNQIKKPSQILRKKYIY